MGIEQFLLKDRVAIITGASQGLGEALANAFVSAGAKVVLASRRLEKLKEITEQLRSNGYEALPLRVDITNPNDVQEMADHTIKRFGRIDILVNNAAIISNTSLLESTYEEWKRVLDTNLNGIFLCCQVVGKKLIENGRGKIVNISSIFGELGVSRMASYGVSKGGVIQLTRIAAVDMGRHNINVNCIAPGFFISPINIETYNRDVRLLEATLRRIPLRREARMEEITGAAIFLASDAAGYITGQTIFVDGGWSIYGNVIF